MYFGYVLTGNQSRSWNIRRFWKSSSVYEEEVCHGWGAGGQIVWSIWHLCWCNKDFSILATLHNNAFHFIRPIIESLNVVCALFLVILGIGWRFRSTDQKALRKCKFLIFWLFHVHSKSTRLYLCLNFKIGYQIFLKWFFFCDLFMLQLAELWPNRLMDNHGIKRAICRAKERRRALHANLGKEMVFFFFLNSQLSFHDLSQCDHSSVHFLIEGSREDEEETDTVGTKIREYSLSRQGFRCWR